MADPKEPREFPDLSDNATNNGYYDQDWDSIRPTRNARNYDEPDDSEDCFFDEAELGGEA